MQNDPQMASQMMSKMSWAGQISEKQAKNVQPEALNLSWTAKEKTLNLIKHFEWFTPKAFWDYKQWTRWYGTQAPWKWASISKDKASSELEWKINTEYNLKKELSKRWLSWVYEKLWDNQIAALTSFIFNLWPWKINSIKWPLQQFEQSWNPEVVANAMLQFNKAWGKTLSWLVKRRKTEAKLFKEWWKKENSNTNEST
jgi:GH24 family phage-related lysozyme (muramidase)